MEIQRTMLRAKIHRAHVTHADKHYEGSLTIPPVLMNAADIKEHEQIHVWNVTSGTRFVTYAMLGEEGSPNICVNGAAAHLANPGDIIIIACFVSVPESQLKTFHPTVVFVDSANRPKTINSEIAGPGRRDPCE